MPPLRDEPGVGPDDGPGGRRLVAEFVAELGALISELEAASGGSLSLDVRIHHGFHIQGGYGEDIASLLIREGVSWPTVQETQDEIVPPYSTSLDAALQGEDIVFAVRSARQRRWGAMQRTAWGGEVLAWAATEPLARRLAALKCWHAELEKSLAEEDTATEPAADPHTGPSGTVSPVVTQDQEESPGGDAAELREPPESAGHDEADRSDEATEKDWKILF